MPFLISMTVNKTLGIFIIKLLAINKIVISTFRRLDAWLTKFSMYIIAVA